MDQKQQSRPGEGRLGCDRLPGATHPTSNPLPQLVQFVIAAHHVRPELAAMVAALAFGGGAYHG